jgi:hypothetical protein
MNLESTFFLAVGLFSLGLCCYHFGKMHGRESGWADATLLWQTAYLNSLRCECGGPLLKGPRGGASINCTCAYCNQKYNFTPLGLDKL